MRDFIYKKMNKLYTAICCMVIMLVAASCKTAKNKDTSIDLLREEIREWISTSTDSIVKNMMMSSKETNERMSNMKVESKTIYYTVPDSTGKQYPAVVNETKSTNEEKESSQKDTELYASVTILSEKVDELSEKVDESLKKDEKVVEISWWDRHKDKVYITFALIIVSWMIYKSRKK